MFLYNSKMFSYINLTDLRTEESILITFLAMNGSTMCFNITIDPMSCEYTVEMYSEEPGVNIIILSTKIFIGAKRPFCGKTILVFSFFDNNNYIEYLKLRVHNPYYIKNITLKL